MCYKDSKNCIKYGYILLLTGILTSDTVDNLVLLGILVNLKLCLSYFFKADKACNLILLFFKHKSDNCGAFINNPINGIKHASVSRLPLKSNLIKF